MFLENGNALKMIRIGASSKLNRNKTPVESKFVHGIVKKPLKERLARDGVKVWYFLKDSAMRLSNDGVKVEFSNQSKSLTNIFNFRYSLGCILAKVSSVC